MPKSPVTTSRRSILQGLAIAAQTARADHTAPKTKPVAQPVVETTSGKVRGYCLNGTCTFKGIPYGASTAGAGRFLPPRKPVPWTGVRSTVNYGHISPHA